MKIHRSTRILSVILVLALLFHMMPVTSFAAETSDETITETSAGPPPVTVLGEVEELREEDTKHFRLSDGSFIAVSYGMPVHFRNGIGQWQDIDNRLFLASGAYRTANASTPVAFSSTLTDGKLFSVERDGQSVSMSLLDSAEAERMISGEAEEAVPEETIPEETVPEETIPEETIPEETIPEETISEEAVPEETIPEETIPEETIPEETIPEETIPEETIPEETISEEAVPEETIPEETVPEETTPEETVPEETVPEETIPEEFVPEETIPAETVPEETIPEETIPEETIPEETVPEETIPEETVPEETGEPELEESADALAFDRDVIARVTEDAPPMLTLQEKYSWDVNDIIPEKLYSSLVYEDVFPGVDLQYSTFGYNIKEQIIIWQPRETYRFDFLLESGGVTPVLLEDGSVSFLNGDREEVYHIPIPCMEDAAGFGSFDVRYALHETEQGTILTVEADPEWINSKDRTYPVKIDPTLEVVSGNALEDIYSAYTMEAAPNDPTLGRQWLYVGAQPYSTTNDGRYRIYMHFQSMPTVPEGSEVVDAQLSLYKLAYVQRYCEQFPIGAYEVTTSLPSGYSSYYDWFSKMTWSRDQPAYDTTNAIDYAFGRAGKEYLTWHLTELVKKWYIEGTDNTTIALAMMNEDEIDTYYYFASATFYAYAGSIPPILTVSYRNNTGIEPYYTYATLGAGAAGTAHISDHTGDLKIAKELVSYASATNPVSLNLIYNSDYFARSSADYSPPGKLGLSMHVGSGWTLDCIRRVDEETISGVPYLKYTDGDGTIHYFRKDTSKDSSGTYYYDEDGLGLKMKITGTNAYLMSDDSGNEWTFSGKFLRSVKDSDGNKINFNFSNGKLLSITQVNNGQSSITVASFTYTGNNLTGFTDAAGNAHTLTYSGTKLTGIKRGSTNLAAYTYSGYRVTKMTDSESGYSLNFTYSSGKVSRYQESSGSGTGATVSVTYPNHSKTVYQDYGADRTSGSSDDILTTYLFDYAGRTVNAYTTDKSGNILGASNAAYSGSGSTDKANNRTLRSASIGVAGQQLLRNTGVESTSNAWTFSGASRASTKPRTGGYSVKGTLSSNGTQYAQKASESLTAGTKYTFSGYVNTSGVTGFSGTGVYLRVTDGSGHTWDSSPVNYATSSAVDGGWVRVSVSFTASVSGAHTVAVYNKGAIGTFYADDFQLEKGEAPSSCNLVENGGMQMGSFGWTLGAGVSHDTTKGASGSGASLKILGDPDDATTNAYQDIPLSLPGTQTYILSGWAWANAVPDGDSANATGTSKKCGLRAILYYSDGATENHYVPFNADLSKDWQFTSMTIVPKSPTKTVSKIRVVCAYETNANVAYFDNISLVREAAQTMRYDSNGNLVSVSTPGLSADTNTYSGGNLIKTVTGGNGTYQYTYDTTYTHRLKSVTNGQLTQTLGHDVTGNVTTTTLSGSGGKTMSTSATYGGAMNRLVSVTDAAGATVTYGYGNALSQMLALPTSATGPDGTVTTSAYDASGRTTRTGITGTGNLVYAYSGGNLSSIKRTDGGGGVQTYSFGYNAFGSMTSLKVGSRTLASYTYGNGNGQLTKQTYGNGASGTFAYDNLGRTKTATYSGGQVLSYTYNGEGRLHSVTQTGGGANNTCLYTYDAMGRLITSEQKSGSTTVLRTNQTYNSYNQLTRQSWQMGSTAYSESYTYNSSDGSLNTMTTASGNTLTMGYDGLRRLSTVTGGPVTRQYTYRDIGSNKTTMQVSSVTSGGLSFGYTYDARGNIASYAAPGEGTVTYTYDNQGQLLKAQGGTTYTYTYDTVGNLLTASDGTTAHTYTYGNTDWKDLLTAFDGQSITYDTSGNPTSYYNGTRWTMGWVNGRQLASAQSSAVDLSFTYGIDGLRTGKAVGSISHSYLYAGGKLLRESYSGKTLDFIYDANGTPYALKYNGTVYYYVTNLQGDVVRLVDSGKDTVAEYRYDPYGKVISATGTMAEINPLRYRGYYYDAETGMYYVSNRYYDPVVGRFINADDLDYIGADGSLLSYNLFAYCMNNPVNRFDVNGNLSLPNWAKITIGVVATVAAVAITVATGGAAAPVLIGVATSTVGGAVTGAIKHRVTSGSWDGAGKAALDGAVDGFMTGGLCAFGGSVIGGALRTIKNARSGITIGKMGTFEDVADLAKARHYSGLKEFDFVRKIAGQEAAETIGWWQNKCVVKGVMALKGAIYDCGGALTGAYAKEVALTKGYQYLYNVWLM